MRNTLQQMRKLAILFFLTVLAIGAYAQEQSTQKVTEIQIVKDEVAINGPMGTKFDESMQSTYAILSKRLPNKVQMHDSQIDITDPFMFMETQFSSGVFLFKDNKFKMSVFLFNLDYQDAMTQKLDMTQAQQWLNVNRSQVNSYFDYLAKTLESKYGYASRVTNNSLLWIDDNRNTIKLEIEQTPNKDTSGKYYAQYGAIPAFTIALLYIQNDPTLNDF